MKAPNLGVSFDRRKIVDHSKSFFFQTTEFVFKIFQWSAFSAVLIATSLRTKNYALTFTGVILLILVAFNVCNRINREVIERFGQIDPRRPRLGTAVFLFVFCTGSLISVGITYMLIRLTLDSIHLSFEALK